MGSWIKRRQGKTKLGMKWDKGEKGLRSNVDKAIDGNEEKIKH